MDGKQLGHLGLRLILGMNIFIHGVARLGAIPQFASKMAADFEGVLPTGLVLPFGYALPFIELVLGAMLLVGLRMRVASFGGALLIAVLTFGSSMAQRWDVVGLQLIYGIAYFHLLVHEDYATWALDGLRRERKHASARDA